ncbi:hypothetical protein [Actinomyces vulturis]|uniref:hypothetical protein n=1 Tax=Actinomyces vulturis TaxID=1857645 RepID=UPI00082969C9|nr:hypothetical protein [Actinomyces vulturis]
MQRTDLMLISDEFGTHLPDGSLYGTGTLPPPLIFVDLAIVRVLIVSSLIAFIAMTGMSLKEDEHDRQFSTSWVFFIEHSFLRVASCTTRRHSQNIRHKHLVDRCSIH